MKNTEDKFRDNLQYSGMKVTALVNIDLGYEGYDWQGYDEQGNYHKGRHYKLSGELTAGSTGVIHNEGRRLRVEFDNPVPMGGINKTYRQHYANIEELEKFWKLETSTLN